MRELVADSRSALPAPVPLWVSAAIPTCAGATTAAKRMDKKPVTRAERPRVEPEILPPGDPRTRYEGMFGGTHHIHVASIGPFRFAVLALGIALLAALVLFLVLGVSWSWYRLPDCCWRSLS